MNLQETIFGANWRTTLSGIGSAITSFLTILAALPYELGDVATIFPPEWKARIAVAGGVATVLLRVMNSAAAKDAKVSGNGSLDDPNRTVTGSGTRSRHVALLAIFAVPMFSGCAVSTDPTTGKTNVVASVTWADAIAISQAIGAAKRGNDAKAVRALERASAL